MQHMANDHLAKGKSSRVQKPARKQRCASKRRQCCILGYHMLWSWAPEGLWADTRAGFGHYTTSYFTYPRNFLSYNSHYSFCQYQFCILWKNQN